MTDTQFSTLAIIDEGAQVRERVDYDAYGRPRHHRMADLTGDGAVDSLDQIILINHWGSASCADLNRDGVVDSIDQSIVISEWGEALPAGTLSTTGNILGYAGYIYDAELEIYLARHRWYDPELGRWLQRDPAGYVDGLNLYLYASSSPFVFVDPMGLWSLRKLAGSVCDMLGIEGNARTYALMAGTGADIAGSVAANEVKTRAQATIEEFREDPLGAFERRFDPQTILEEQVRSVFERSAAIEMTRAEMYGEEPTLLGTLSNVPAVATGMQDLAEGIAGHNMAQDRSMTVSERWISGMRGTVQGGTFVAGGGMLGRPASPTPRNAAQRQAFLREQADAKGTPGWQKQWLHEGRTPPGYDVDHIRPLSIGGTNDPSNMRLILRADHRIHHKFYRPWQQNNQ